MARKAASVVPRKPALLSKEQREAIERELSHPYGRAELRIDGHLVQLQVRKFKELRYCVMVFIDGSWKGEYSRIDSEIGAKFFRPESHQLLRRKDIEAHRKAFGKRAAADFAKRCTLQTRVTCYSTARSFLRYVQTTASAIDVVSVGYETKPAEAEVAGAPEPA